MNKQTLHIDLGSRSYDIVIGTGLLKEGGEYIQPLLSLPSVIIITDEQVAPHYAHLLEQSLEHKGIHAARIVLKPGERSKSFGGLEWLLDRIFEHKPERKTTLIALGGGVVGDITGFAASIMLRGIPFIQIPTTLLSQVDSAVGGKTGINHASGKNLVGSFYQPKRVLIDIDVLSTLPTRQFLAGYAEVVKYGLIQDAAFFTWLDTHQSKVNARDPESLQHLIASSCQTKANIVAQDEKEKNIRALLNFGHTFGHALEAVTGYKDKLLHGEAVALGMLMATDLSVQLGLCGQEVYSQVKAHLMAMALPTSLKQIEGVTWKPATIIEAMQQDKKMQQGELTFVLLKGIGKGVLKSSIPMNRVQDVVERAL